MARSLSSPSLRAANFLRKEKPLRADSGEQMNRSPHREASKREERSTAREQSKRWLERQNVTLNSIAKSRQTKEERDLQGEQTQLSRARAVRKRALIGLFNRGMECRCCEVLPGQHVLDILNSESDTVGNVEDRTERVAVDPPSLGSRALPVPVERRLENYLEEPGGAHTVARVRQEMRNVAEQQSKAAADVRAAKQYVLLKEKQRTKARQRIMQRTESSPVLNLTGVNAEKPSGMDDVCEGCLALFSSQDFYYLCLSCLSKRNIRFCLCTTCHDMRELVHDEHPPHIFVQSDMFATSGKVQTLGAGASAFNLHKIDFHQHCVHEDYEGLVELLKVNAEWKVERCVLLALRPLEGGSRAEVMRRNDWVLRMAQEHPEIVPFVTVVEDDPAAPQMLKDCLERGAKGLKLIGWHSSFIKKYDYDLRHPAMLEVYQLAASWEIPVLAHVYIAMKNKRDYVKDIDEIMTTVPKLKFVLAHLGLGFDEENLPRLEQLAEKHSTLYFDTSFYGGHREVWFSRASNRAGALHKFVLKFSRQVLFGSDVYADSRFVGALEYHRALRASTSFLQFNTFACLEFRRTEHFDSVERDRFGPVNFDPYHLNGLSLSGNDVILRRLLKDNALKVLGLQCVMDPL